MIVRKLIATLFVMFLFSTSLVSIALAANIALTVQNRNSLSEEHEKKIYNILKEIHNVTLVDKDVNVSYYDFDLIVIANNPFSSPSSPLNSFIKDIPVNEVSTLSIYPGFIKEWGWVKPGGISSVMRTDRQNVIIQLSHPTTEGFKLGEKVYVHLVKGTKVINLYRTHTNMKFATTADYLGKLGTIAFAPPGAQLLNNKTVSNNSGIVFFGIVSPVYWTDEAIILFNNSVNWLLELKLPSILETPILSGPSSSRTGNVMYTWNQPFSPIGISHYQFQLSTEENFTTLLKDVTTTNLFYEVIGLADNKTYYARVRAIDWQDKKSEWSNTVKTIVDFSDLILTILSPINNTKLSLGQEIFVNATLDATRVLDGSNCTITIGNEFVGNVTYNQTLGLCSGYITIPTTLGQGAFGLSDFTLSATTYLATKNSSSINVIFEREISVSIATDKTIYSPNETALVSGEVFLSDNKRKISDATVNYSVFDNITGTIRTDVEGRYSFTIPNLTLGRYTINVIAAYKSVNATNSISFSVRLPTLPAGTFIAIPNMTIRFPEKLIGYTGENVSFEVVVENTGNVDLHNVKIIIPDFDGRIIVRPTKANISYLASQVFKVTIHLPEKAGNYTLYINAISEEKNVTGKFRLEVLKKPEIPKIRFPVLQIIESVFPTFYENETATIVFTLENTGNLTSNATVRVDLPEGWNVDEREKTISIAEGRKERISFNVTPSNKSGNISITVSYLSLGEEKKLGESFAVEVKIRERPLTITGFIVALVSSPEFYVPFSVAAILVISFFVIKKMLKKKERVKVSVREIKPRKFFNRNINYEKWEERYRKG